MEAKIRIIEIFPKVQSIKNNPKDIISLSFISNEYSTKIENLEQSIRKNEKKIIKLKEQNVKKNIIKCLLIKNNQNIIASGEFNLEEGINWYKLSEAKNNMMSKESLITSSTSNGNIIQNINNNQNSYFICNSPNSLETNISIENNKYFSYKNSKLTKEQYIKIKLMVIFIKRKNLNKYNNFNSINNEHRDTSFRIRESHVEKGIDYFDNSLNDMDISKLNLKAKLFTDNKKSNIRKTILFGNQQKNSSKKRINFLDSNKNRLTPIASGENITLNSNKEHSYSIKDNNSKKSSKIKNGKIIKNKKFINEGLKMRTSFNFYRKKNNSDNKYILEKKLTTKNSNKKEKKHHKLNSCENFEDKILDQNYKNYLKNDENLKANLTNNDSYNLFDRNNTDRTKDKYQTKKIEQELYNKDTNNNDKNNDIIYKKQNLNINNNNETENDYTNENYERLKIDFLLLYSDENIQNINKEDYFLETQLMVEKLLNLQYIYQKEYNQIFNSINTNKKFVKNYKNLFILLTKKINKLHTKKLEHSLKKSNNKIYNESLSNFSKERRKIIQDHEFSIWNKLMKNSNKSSIIENSKNKMINIFLNICSKKENKLNKLSLKFYNEIKEKQNIIKNKKIEDNKKSKYKISDNKKVIFIDTKINPNIKENNFFLNKTSKNYYSFNYNPPTTKGNTGKISKKNSTSKMLSKINPSNKYGTLVNETSVNYYTKKLNQKNRQLNIENKLYIARKSVNNNH